MAAPRAWLRRFAQAFLSSMSAARTSSNERRTATLEGAWGLGIQPVAQAELGKDTSVDPIGFCQLASALSVVTHLTWINEAEGNPGLGESQGEQEFVGAAGLKNDEGRRALSELGGANQRREELLDGGLLTGDLAVFAVTPDIEPGLGYVDTNVGVFE